MFLLVGIDITYPNNPNTYSSKGSLRVNVNTEIQAKPRDSASILIHVTRVLIEQVK